MAVVSKKYKGAKKWYVVRNITINGKVNREYLSQGLSTKAEAMALDAKCKSRKLRQVKKELTFGDVYLGFLEGYKGNSKKTIRPLTLKSFEYASKYFLESLKHRAIETIDYNDIESLKTACHNAGLSNRTINIVLLNLKKVFNHAVYCGHIPVIPPILSLPENKTKKIRRLYEAEIKALINVSGVDQRRFITLMLQTGLRPYEAFCLKWKHINFKNRYLEVFSENKLKSGRKIPITDALMGLLLESKVESSSEFVVPYRTGDVARKVIRRIAKRAGLSDVSVYTFRKTFGSMMAEAGVPVFDLAKIMGHSEISTTYKYYIDIQHKTLEAAMSKMPDFRYSLGTEKIMQNDMGRHAIESLNKESHKIT